MKSIILYLGILFISFILIYSCDKNSTGITENQSESVPEILYIAHKFVNQGWGVAVSINIMDAQGKNHQEILSVNDGYINDAYFSNDGEKIIFVMHSDSLGIGENLYTMNYDGTDILQVTLSDTILSYAVPQFTPDKSNVIYLARVNYQEIQIRILDINSKQQTILVPQTNDSRRPVLSLDGSYLFYNHIDGNVHRILLNDYSDEKLTNFSYSSQIQLSGNGNTVYFVSQIENQLFDLFSMTLNGENIGRVTNLNNLSNAFFRISLDESKIINLTSSQAGHSFDIMNSDGSGRKTVPLNRAGGDSFEFFPEGKNILFEAEGGISYNNNFHIYRIGISGDYIRIISDNQYHHNQFCCFKPKM